MNQIIDAPYPISKKCDEKKNKFILFNMREI